MGKIIAKRDTPTQCFARLGLDNGDQIMITVAASGVKVFKMWVGIFPAATLWTSHTVSDAFTRFLEERRPLDEMIEKLIDCRSAAEVAGRLSS